MSVAVLVGSAASLLSLYATVPQVVRAARTRSAEGVSWSSILLSMATFALWCVYAVAVADSIQLVNNSLAVALLFALATLLGWSGTVLWLLYGLLAHNWPLTVCCLVLGGMQSVVLAHRLPPRRTLASLAGGRLGGPVAWVAAPIAARLPEHQARYELAA